MMMVARDMDYSDLCERVRGKRVLIWTCNTCARLCNDLGGDVAAERLREAFAKDGIDVMSVASTSASCIERKIRAKADVSGCDAVVCLTCDIGSACTKRVLGIEVINPLITIGNGFIGEDGLYVIDGENIERYEKSVQQSGKSLDPVV